jgi:3-hydroxyacyl-CoA dehydrogenase / enoyl-CoA hydratase / 3-hydroxybutyryl-CoA epimerase
MKLTTMSYEVTDDGIAIVTIDVKDRPMNILTPELHQDVGRVAEQLALDDKAIGAVIQSAKPAFVAGGDLKRLVGLYDLNQSPEEAYLQSRTFTEALRKLETCGKAVACAINGAALGGGLELALACHYRVVIDDPEIPLGLPETGVGLIPGAGGTQRLPRLIGIKEAAALILSGKHISPQQALKLGMVDKLVDEEQLLSEAKRWVLEEARSEQAWDRRGFQIPGGATLNNPKIAKLYQDLTTQVAVETRYNYPAPIAALKSIFNGTTVSSFDTALKIETREFSKLTRDPVARNMTRTLFLNKGIADRLDKRPDGIDKFKTEHIAILGDSSKSDSLAYACAIAGIDVTITGNNNSQAAIAYAQKQLEQRIDSGLTTREKADAILSRIGSDDDDADLKQFELLVITNKIDSITLSEWLTAIDNSTIIAVDTSQIPLADVIKIAALAEQVVGWHIKHPAERAQAIEIILNENTSDETLARVLDFTQQLRLTPVLQKDHLALFSQACIIAYLEEGLQLLHEGVNPVLIENAARDAGMPKGPLALIDKMSLSQVLQSVKENSSASKILQSMIEDHGRTGMTEGKGFYEYSDDNGKMIWQQLTQHFSPQTQQVDVEMVKQRLLCIQSLKAASYLEAGLIDTVDADIASVLIWGFPSYTGGVLSYIDTMEISNFIKHCEQLADQYGEQYKASEWLYKKAKENDRVYAKVA